MACDNNQQRGTVAANFVPTPYEKWGQPGLDDRLAVMLDSTWWNGTDPLVAHYACMAMLQALIEGGFEVDQGPRS